MDVLFQCSSRRTRVAIQWVLREDQASSASLHGLLLSLVENVAMLPASRRSRRPPCDWPRYRWRSELRRSAGCEHTRRPREYLLALLWNQLHECEGKQIAGERMPAGVGSWLWIQRAHGVKSACRPDRGGDGDRYSSVDCLPRFHPCEHAQRVWLSRGMPPQ